MVTKDGARIQPDVITEPVEKSDVHSEEIGSTDGEVAVTPGNYVDDYPGEAAAEHDSGSFLGVNMLTEDIKVKLPVSYERVDAGIVEASVLLLIGVYRYHVKRAKVTMQDGWITLSSKIDS